MFRSYIILRGNPAHSNRTLCNISTVLTEMQAVETLETYGYDPVVIHGDSLAAYHDPDSGWGFAVVELLERLNETSLRHFDDPVFLMPIEERIRATGRQGVFASGRILEGSVSISDPVKLLGFGERKSVTVTSISMLSRLIDEAIAGDNVIVGLRGVEGSEVCRGQILAAPGAIEQYEKFKAFIHVMDAGEGNKAPLLSREILSCYFILLTFRAA